MAIGSMLSNPLYGSIFDLLMSAYGGLGDENVANRFGLPPMGTTTAQPQSSMPTYAGGLGGIGGGLVGSYFGGPTGGLIGSKLGSVTSGLLAQREQPLPMPSTPPPAAKKPISRVSPSDQFQINQAISSLPPELQQSFSQTFGLY